MFVAEGSAHAEKHLTLQLEASYPFPNNFGSNVCVCLTVDLFPRSEVSPRCQTVVLLADEVQLVL